jgi:hypothetical protein
MRTISGRIAAVALAMAACAGCSDGASKAVASGGEAQGERITAVGCPATPKAECVTIAAKGQNYDITSAGVDVAGGLGISVTGLAAGEVTACGSKLTDVKVEYQNIKCGAPAPAPAPAS